MNSKLPKNQSEQIELTASPTNEKELKELLEKLLELMNSEKVPAVYAMCLMNSLMDSQTTNPLFTDKNKKLGQQVWSKMAIAGIQLEVPPLLA